MDRPRLSVIIPAYNERERLPDTLDKVTAYLRTNAWSYEILVVDDGSTDGTLAFAEDYASRHPAVRVLANGMNRGKGYSVKQGLLLARGGILLFSDSDLSTPIEELPKLLARLENGFDLAIASRAYPGARLERPQPFHRRLMGAVFRVSVWISTGLYFRDTQCGFKAMTREAALVIGPRLSIPGFGFDVELLWLARRFSLRAAEVGVVWRNDPRSRVSPIRDAWLMFTDLFRIGLRSLKGKYR